MLYILATHHESIRPTFETPWVKLRNLLGTKLTTDVTLLFLSAVDNYICVYLMSKVWTIKLIESVNICYVSVRAACTIKVNIKETFMGNDGFMHYYSTN